MEMPKAPSPPPNTPTRADASVLTQALRQPQRGYSLITNTARGALASRTGRRTTTTGGTQQ